MKVNDLSVRIGGQAGDGALTTGDTLATVLHRMGLYVGTYKDFPSQIRGIHTNYTIYARSTPVYARPESLDVLLAFDRETVDRHVHELEPGGFIIYESTRGDYTGEIRDDVHLLNVPLRKIAMEVAGKEVMKNTVALGVLGAMVHLDRNVMLKIFEERFLKRKGQAVVDANIRAYDAGVSFFEQSGVTPPEIRVENLGEPKGYLMMGNEAIAFGALVAGCRFFAGYPITPASEIMEWLAVYLPKFNGVVVQAEDEISSINMAIGAAIGGARAMTATSGPGFALMTEALSYAGMVEVPVVIVDCSRAGPSTGMPTKSEQSDVFHSVFGGHGDFPRAVLAPKDPQEAYEMTIQAFNLAEKYQMPVILLVDQFLAQNKFSVPGFSKEVHIDRGRTVTSEEALSQAQNGGFKRYQITEDGVSPRTIPGLANGLFWLTGVEHDEKGHVSTYSKVRVAMMEKRLKKLQTAMSEFPEPVTFGNPDASKVVFTFGSTTGSVLEALKDEPEVFVIQIRTLWPFEKNKVSHLANDKEVFVVEVNAQGQLAYLVEHALGRPVRRVLKYNGRPFRPSEIRKEILS